jgi:hypothetical protein
MGDMLQQAADWLAGMRKQHMAREVTYARGQVSVQLLAAVGQTVFEVDSGLPVAQRWESRDFLVAAADLVLGGEPVEPQRGDRITDGGVVYEVLAPGNEDCFRKSDPYGVTLRIHTKQVATE